MNNSMISAMVSMNALQQRLDVIADNMANVNTAGYKKKEASFDDVLTQVQGHHKDFDRTGRSTPLGYTLGYGMRLSSVVQNMEQGAMKETGNPFDLMIDGQAMFAVQGDGAIGYTREGGFHVTPDARNPNNLLLANSQGYPVLDVNNNPISFPSKGKVAVNEKGQIILETFAGVRSIVATLKVVELERPEGLVAVGDNLFVVGEGLTEGDVFDLTPPAPGEPPKSSVLSGFVEQSNVNLTDEMTKMMEVQRAYQLMARALSSSDTMMNLANTMRG
ncbi:fagellar hook-basal body protein [Paenibacillus vortex V453]|jgi:flagellar basal-body rod protein FlgG|uniref:Fagellar hook-basal body protein n=1 Tax=Paenibacillus vortex V453 TaxID=715225 RepID=A0A2R9SLH1_9BACL|nr:MULTISPECIES: flagellar hook-basal body protein [Paenibacillus]ANA79807.1 flagellar biosynthesis protein FlgG [Paenibacillus glucanolyticus]AVV56168.1 flagellar hook-basal body protein [Paenibacillus glucanolyticus]AWP30706.1 flagellar biosynthesis protein FlgG [Paenibacillus sp. Cedars]EFU38213.1 fagellar hook-basal body protein [Paenibacillus vortex V453]ETT38181.1 flagellar hook-basal body protein [Paenibacillus sp. FSL R5-808]